MFQNIVITALVLLMSASLSAAKSFPESEIAEGSTEPKLQIISVTQEHLEVNFLSPTSGIHVLSQVHSSGQTVQLSITSMNGEIIFAVDHPIDSSNALLTLAGSEFLMINETLASGESKLTEYAVSESYSLQVKNAMKQDLVSKPLLRHLDGENVDASGRNAIDNLLRQPEIELIASAAVALGNSGLYGYENPAAMAFYATALRFSTALTEHVHDRDMSGAAKRHKRGLFTWLNPISAISRILDWTLGDHCSNYDDSRCFVCPRGSNCLGMCGPGCTECWPWVCGDCCWNLGCYIHDRLCSNETMTLQCWLTAPIAILCT